MKDWYKDDIEEENSESKFGLERHLNSDLEQNSESFNVLKWWKDEKSNYKVLSLMAKDILANSSVHGSLSVFF